MGRCEIIENRTYNIIHQQKYVVEHDIKESSKHVYTVIVFFSALQHLCRSDIAMLRVVHDNCYIVSVSNCASPIHARKQNVGAQTEPWLVEEEKVGSKDGSQWAT